MKVYFDNAATTPLDERVLEAMLPYMRDTYGNPSSIHGFGRSARAAIERSRKRIADNIGASMSEIFFTSGGTESNNMAIQCAVRDLEVSHVISSSIEHHCVENNVKRLEEQGFVKVHIVRLKEDGHIDQEHLAELLQACPEGKTLVTLMHANNEIGNLLNLETIGKLCRANGAYFHSDTVQTVAHYNFDLNKLPIDFISGAGHKFHGPKGCGFIYINNETVIKPLILGGGQERNMRAGTENTYGIIGLGTAIDLAYEELEDTRAHIESLKFYMAEKLQETVSGIGFNGDWKNGLYTVLNVRFPDYGKGDMLLFNLDIKGIAVSGGSACSSGSNIGSHVINALRELNGDADGSSSIRFSFSHYNTKEEVDFVLKTIAEIYSTSKVKVI
jgi:cysteine desulfurase